MDNLKIGFIGQGFVGKNYADNFENRGYGVVRYSLEENHLDNKVKINDCDIVFIAVPTPTIQGEFIFTAVQDSLKLVGDGKIAVIKSTLLPGTTDTLQKMFKNIFVFHCPEFLSESTAKEDVDSPGRNIVGVTELTKINQEKAELVLAALPSAPFSKIMTAKEAELVKYAGNCFLYEKVVFFNQIYDVSKSIGADYENIREAVVQDKRIGASHTHIFDQLVSDDDTLKRGSGGNCFIKDFEAFLKFYKEKLPSDVAGYNSLHSIRDKNNQYLISTNKDLDILEKVTKEDLLIQNKSELI
ncbi:MAG: hypothetical protein RJA61_394 [Candidatus Parcubacteria bacterium]